MAELKMHFAATIFALVNEIFACAGFDGFRVVYFTALYFVLLPFVSHFEWIFDMTFFQPMHTIILVSNICGYFLFVFVHFEFDVYVSFVFPARRMF